MLRLNRIKNHYQHFYLIVVLLLFFLNRKIADILGRHRSFWNWKHEIHGKIMIMLKKIMIMIMIVIIEYE